MSSSSTSTRVTFHVTGFGRFQGVEDNPSAKISRSLAGHASVASTDVVEVSTVGADATIARIADEARAPSQSQPDDDSHYHVFLHFGVAAGAPCFFLEQAAANDKSFRIPDERGIQPRAEPIEATEPFAHQRLTFIVVKELVPAMLKRGYPVQASRDAGRFLCNYIYYRSLQAAERLNRAEAASTGREVNPVASRALPRNLSLFVHVPSEDVADAVTQARFARDLMEEITASIATGSVAAEAASLGGGAGQAASVSTAEKEGDDAVAAAKSGLVTPAANHASLRGSGSGSSSSSSASSSSSSASSDVRFAPLFAAMMQLGFEEDACVAAVKHLGPLAPMEEALEWVLAYQESGGKPATTPSPAPSGPAPILGFRLDLHPAPVGAGSALSASASASATSPAHAVLTRLKMVIVVRSDLEMGKGKIAAQACHVALKCVRQLNKRKEFAPLVAAWEASGEPIVVLKGEGFDQLQALKAAAGEAGVPAFFIHDAGRTQVDPGTVTVLGLGPAEESRIDTVTGSLKLL
jgi:PTH2 family peptidyl-tRNA hydrolase